MPASSPNRVPLFLLVVSLAFALWLWVPHALTDEMRITPAARLTLENQLRDTGAKFIWAALTLLLAALAWNQLKAMSKVVEQSAQTLAAAERTAYFTAQAGETERFARAMALLGSAQLEVRIGGVYALERLARESERDHGPIMEVLAATLRDRLAWREGEAAPARVESDLQAALTVLGRRHVAFDAPEFHLDLHATNLARAYLPFANLANGYLYECNLEGAVLQNADLRGAWCFKTNFANAVLDGAHLEGADLTGASNLTWAQLQNTHRDDTTKMPEHLRSQRDFSPVPAPEETDSNDLKLPTRRG